MFSLDGSLNSMSTPLDTLFTACIPQPRKLVASPISLIICRHIMYSILTDAGVNNSAHCLASSCKDDNVIFILT